MIRKMLQQSDQLCSMSLVDYIRYCCTGKFPQDVQDILDRGGPLADLLCAAAVVGALEPLCATRPGVCDPAVVVDKDISVPPATLNPDGTVTPSEERAISLCAPMKRALVVETLRVTAANQTAASQPTTQPVFKKVNLGGFGEWCLPFEPADMEAQFTNVEHIVIPPGGGFSVYVQNFNPASEAVYHLNARMWACC